MIVLKNNQVYSDADKYIHRKDSDSYFKRGTTLPSDTLDTFEEVDELPKYTAEEYEQRVNELIRLEYTESQEFSLLRQKEDKMEEYAEYYAYCEQCKLRAKMELSERTTTEEEV